MVHTNERPHKCTLCDRTFRIKQRCDLHIRTHYGEKPYREIEKNRPKRIRRRKPKVKESQALNENELPEELFINSNIL